MKTSNISSYHSQPLKTASQNNSSMSKIKVIHERPNCIACGACAAISPDFWEMDEDGLSTLKGAVKVDDNFELEITEEQKATNQEAAEVCPVQIIHVKEE